MASSDNKTLLTKAARFCAYRERCQQEVRMRLHEYGASPGQAEEALAELIGMGFVNEERFARLYAGGKFRQKKWGRNKIRMELQKRNLTPYCIEQGLREIDEAEYRNTLKDLIRKKYRLLKGVKAVRNRKTAGYCLQKGYEAELVWECVNAAEL